MGHPSVDEMRAYVQGRLGGAERTGLEAHVRTCETCGERLELIEMALAASAAAPERLEDGLPAMDEAPIRHRHLAGNDARLEAALRGGLRDPAAAPAKAPIPLWRSRAVGVGMAVAAALLLIPLTFDRGTSEATEVTPGAPLSFVIEGAAATTRGVPAAHLGIVHADFATEVAPGQGARISIDPPEAGWLYVLKVDGDGAARLPGLPDAGLRVEAGEQVTVPSPELPAWRPSGDPGNIDIAVVLSDAPLEPEAFAALPAGDRAWDQLKQTIEGHVYKGVLVFGE